MNCPDLNRLSRFQDGALPQDEARVVEEHLLSCRECDRRFRLLGRVGLVFLRTVGSHRNLDCPSAEEIGTYVDGLLFGREREHIESHLVNCSRCLHEVGVFSDASATQPSIERPAKGSTDTDGSAAGNQGRRILAFSTSRVMRVAAAVALMALVLVPSLRPLLRRSAGVPGPVSPESMITAVAAAEQDVLTLDQAQSARLAREVGLILRQVEEVALVPSEERVTLLKEDVVNSGLVYSLEDLAVDVRDMRLRRFLADAQYVLQQVMRMDETYVTRDLQGIAGEIRRTNLTETARLIELEGGKSLWLASL